MNTNDYMTVQRLLGRLEGLAATVGSKTVESEIFDIVEALDDTIDRYALKRDGGEQETAEKDQQEPNLEKALQWLHAVKAFCAARGAGTCGTCPFWPMCQAVDKPLVDWPEPEEVKPDAQ